MTDSPDLVRQRKKDPERVRQVIAAGYPAVAPILPELVVPNPAVAALWPELEAVVAVGPRDEDEAYLRDSVREVLAASQLSGEWSVTHRSRSNLKEYADEQHFRRASTEFASR